MAVPVDTGPPWYAKCLTCLKNPSRVDPGRIELPHCDFFIVGQKRTLRILKPPLRGGWYYETPNERPDSINDNFFTRWSKRPHPSGNCRCSFRQSARLSTTEEQIISAEINRIRTSLCEAERSGQDIGELEQKISVNLENLIPVSNEPKPERKIEEKLTEIADVVPGDSDEGIDEKVIKTKIIKDLEKYINNLLEEILNDTVKFIADSEKFVQKDHDCAKSVCVELDHLNSCKSFEDICTKDLPKTDSKLPETSVDKIDSFSNISFAFHNDRVSQEEALKITSQSPGYVNPAFLGSSSDPDALEFYLHRPIGKNITNCTLEQLDCVDSGINSVETVEFQPEQEPSLEESLMEIIDAKFGRNHLRRSWEDFQSSTRNNIEVMPQETVGSNCLEVESKLGRLDAMYPETVKPEIEEDGMQQKSFMQDQPENNDKNGVCKVLNRNHNVADTRNSNDTEELDEVTNDPSFEKLRLEFNDKSLSKDVQLKKNTGASIFRKKVAPNYNDALIENCEDWNDQIEKERLKRCSKLRSVELDDYRKRWSELEESCSSFYERNPRDFVMFRKNRKPVVVFLHGFGSCAEVFSHQLEYFSSLGYPCIAPDLLGHGMSSAPDRSRDYHFDKLLKDLDTVLLHYAFKPGQKCILVAHNYGCSFAAALACKYDSSIHQLVLISGGGPTPLARPSAEGAAHSCLRTAFAPLLMCGLRREIMYSARGRQHPYCGAEPMEQWPSHMKYVLEGMVWPEGDHTFHRRICTPTLLIHGLRDNKVSLVQECQMERTMVKAFLEALPSAGHSPMTDCPDQLNHMIHCFIDLWKNKRMVEQ